MLTNNNMIVSINLRELYMVLGIYIMIPFMICGLVLYCIQIYIGSDLLTMSLGMVSVCVLYMILVRLIDLIIRKIYGEPIDYREYWRM